MRAGQKEADEVAAESLWHRNIYKQQEPLRFDLRKYTAYIKENELKAEDITPEIMGMFSR